MCVSHQFASIGTARHGTMVVFVWPCTRAPNHIQHIDISSTWKRERVSGKKRPSYHVLQCVLYAIPRPNGINYDFPLCAWKFFGFCPKHAHTYTHTHARTLSHRQEWQRFRYMDEIIRLSLSCVQCVVLRWDYLHWIFKLSLDAFKFIAILNGCWDVEQNCDTLLTTVQDGNNAMKEARTHAAYDRW